MVLVVRDESGAKSRMNEVQKAEKKFIELVEQAEAVMQKYPETWMTEDEKHLQSDAKAIRDNVSDAMQKAERLTQAITSTERTYPAPYQALLDELAPLTERKEIVDRFRKAMGAIGKNPYYSHGKTHPWNRVLSQTLANDVFAIWQADRRDADYDHIAMIHRQMDNKSRQGSKVDQARNEWNRVFIQRRDIARHEAEVEIHAANPSWAAMLKEEGKLGQTLESRKGSELALFKEPIEEALIELRTALAESVTGVTDTIYIADIN
jgi:hypothetical protein